LDSERNERKKDNENLTQNLKTILSQYQNKFQEIDQFCQKNLHDIENLQKNNDQNMKDIKSQIIEINNQLKGHITLINTHKEELKNSLNLLRQDISHEIEEEKKTNITLINGFKSQNDQNFQNLRKSFQQIQGEQIQNINDHEDRLKKQEKTMENVKDSLNKNLYEF
jgi:hypothetical protein